jgi:WD40 repeat protein
VGEVDGRAVIVSGSGDNTVRLWDAKDGTPIGEPLTGHEEYVSSVALGEVDGRAVIVSGSGDTTVRLWYLKTSATHSIPLQSQVPALALSSVDRLAIATTRGLIVLEIRR